MIMSTSVIQNNQRCLQKLFPFGGRKGLPLISLMNERILEITDDLTVIIETVKLHANHT